MIRRTVCFGEKQNIVNAEHSLREWISSCIIFKNLFSIFVTTMTQQRTGRFARRRQPSSFFGRLQQVLLHPVAFFQQLPLVEQSRHWLWVAILVLGLIGYSAVRQQTGAAAVMNATGETDSLVIALQAIAPMVLVYFGLMVLLSLVSMLRGQPPDLGLNLRIAIWASVPFGIMALIQLARLFAGYMINSQGISGIFTDAQGWHTLDETLQRVIVNTTRHITVFGLWHLVLLWLGVRHSLRGKWWAILLLMVVWILVVILVPTAFANLTADSASELNSGF